MKVKYVKPIMGKTQINLFTSNYWCFCQNSCSWNNCFEKKPKESVVGTLKNISKVGLLQDFVYRFLKKIVFQKIIATCFHWNSKFIQVNQPAIRLRCKSFKQYLADICLGTQTSPVTRLDLIHLISSYDYMLQLLKKLKLNTNLDLETIH